MILVLIKDLLYLPSGPLCSPLERMKLSELETMIQNMLVYCTVVSCPTLHSG